MRSSNPIHRIAAVSAVSVALFAGALAAHAGETLVTTVPFEFRMGGQVLPAGEYQFQVDQISKGTVLARRLHSSMTAIAMYRSEGDVTREGAPFVKFNVYGEQRFLATIKTTNGTAVTLGRGSMELALVNGHVPSSDEIVGSGTLQAARN